MKTQIRKATKQDIEPALALALRVFLEYDGPDYGSEHCERMRISMEDRLRNVDNYYTDNRLMFVAVDGKRVIGMIETYGTNRISLLFVDGAYQRQGIATALMKKITDELKKKDYKEIVLNASPNGTEFYLNFGFIIDEAQKNPETPWKTPMIYFL